MEKNSFVPHFFPHFSEFNPGIVIPKFIRVFSVVFIDVDVDDVVFGGGSVFDAGVFLLHH